MQQTPLQPAMEVAGPSKLNQTHQIQKYGPISPFATPIRMVLGWRGHPTLVEIAELFFKTAAGK